MGMCFFPVFAWNYFFLAEAQRLFAEDAKIKILSLRSLRDFSLYVSAWDCIFSRRGAKVLRRGRKN
ncbi:MAG: hypothetical protein H6Q14_1473 [Bacteroidetes bacterium]|nr:hypothetical protein [Bacteroidota bacterium]